MTDGQKERTILVLRELLNYSTSQNPFMHEPECITDGKELLEELTWEGFSEPVKESIKKNMVWRDNLSASIKNAKRKTATKAYH